VADLPGARGRAAMRSGLRQSSGPRSRPRAGSPPLVTSARTVRGLLRIPFPSSRSMNSRLLGVCALVTVASCGCPHAYPAAASGARPALLLPDHRETPSLSVAVARDGSTIQVSLPDGTPAIRLLGSGVARVRRQQRSRRVPSTRHRFPRRRHSLPSRAVRGRNARAPGAWDRARGRPPIATGESEASRHHAGVP
jgi:hypothetical protein